MMKNTQGCRLSILPFALAVGITWGLGTLILGWLAIQFHIGNPMVTLIGSVYRGFEPTLMGSLWGGFWGFVDGFIGGLLIAVIYNLCLCCCKKKE